MNAVDNPNPEVKVISRETRDFGKPQTLRDRIFDIIRDIRDPEHPHSLEELSVVDLDSVTIASPPGDTPGYGKISIAFTPTVPHCSLASIIGLSIQSKIRDADVLAPKGDQYYKLRVHCVEGTHASADEINKQLADKERVAAAFDNPKIMNLLRQCTENLPC